MPDILQQNLQEKAEFPSLFLTWLLFDHEPQQPSPESIQKVLEATFGKADLMMPDQTPLTTVSIPSYLAEFQDGSLPVQALIGSAMPFDPQSIGTLPRSQFWNLPNAAALLDSCTHKILLGDMFGSALPYRKRADFLVKLLEAAVELFPDCKLIHPQSSQGLIDPEEVRANTIPEGMKFISYFVNPRFFRIEGGTEMLVDTLGLYALGLPDVQLHYHTLDPNRLINHMLNIASYQFEHDCPIQNGETVDGLDRNGMLHQEIQWRCQYEDSLVQPLRPVLDVEAGEYAAGRREE